MKQLGIDVGGSGIKGAIINTESGELLSDRVRIPTPDDAKPQSIALTLKAICQTLEWTGSVGCGFPAAIRDGVAQTASNIDKSFIGTDVRRVFSEVTGLSVEVVNDADAAGLGEATFGAGHGRDGLSILLTLGTGIGSALVVNGSLIPNSELGHLEFGESIAEKFTSDAVRKSQDLSWDEWGGRLNLFLNHLYRLFYPHRIILGGGASKKFQKYSERLDLPCPVLPAELKNNAGIIGAALAANSAAALAPVQTPESSP